MTRPTDPTAFRTDVLLAQHTTIGLGGNAGYFISCKAIDDIRKALDFAAEKKLPVQILGGGSNVIFPDEGFDGLVVKVDLGGLAFTDDGEFVNVTAGAGVVWDEVVQESILVGLGGIECMSGIPGLVGATPIQNVGAYGQEVSDTIISVKGIKREGLDTVEFATKECGFGYRYSRFKGEDVDRYVITQVVFRLQKSARAVICYDELERYIASRLKLSSLAPGRESLAAVRSAVIALRKKKSMVIDPEDPNSRSVGSFFMNPVLSTEDFAGLRSRWEKSGGEDAIPTFAAPNGIKVPAAWLVEKSGFRRGHRKGGVGISENHSLALVNYGGSTRELLLLADEIQAKVFHSFGVRLEREPVVVRNL